MSEFPPVAVLIGLCGGDRLAWFRTAIESVMAQDYHGQIRIYLGIDGPLPDDLERWISSHKIFFYKVVRNQSNIGLSKTLNRLLEVLEDEPYLFRMDADDLCLPYRFSQQVTFLRANPAVDVVGGAIWEFGENDNVSWMRSYPREHDAIRRYIVKANPMAHVTVCFRRRFFSKLPAYPDKYRYNQDLALWVWGLRKGVVMANLDVPLVCVRTSADFFRRRSYARAMSEFQFYFVAIYDLHGLNWRMIFPLTRFFLRLLPPSLVRLIYHSKARSWVRQLDNNINLEMGSADKASGEAS